MTLRHTNRYCSLIKAFIPSVGECKLALQINLLLPEIIILCDNKQVDRISAERALGVIIDQYFPRTSKECTTCTAAKKQEIYKQCQGHRDLFCYI